MFLTEKEASQRWCPYGQQPIGGRDNSTGAMYVISGNRVPMGDVPSCLGSVCMAWRWQGPKVLREIDMVTADVVDEEPRRGYCGAFGRPIEED